MKTMTDGEKAMVEETIRSMMVMGMGRARAEETAAYELVQWGNWEPNEALAAVREVK